VCVCVCVEYGGAGFHAFHEMDPEIGICGRGMKRRYGAVQRGTWYVFVVALWSLTLLIG